MEGIIQGEKIRVSSFIQNFLCKINKINNSKNKLKK